MEEGIIAGGGSAYIHAAGKVSEVVDSLEGDEKTGARLILKALSLRCSTSQPTQVWKAP